MSERFTEDEYKELEAALDDGFNDWSLSSQKQHKVPLGKLFSTNPLFDVTVKVSNKAAFAGHNVNQISEENITSNPLYDSMDFEQVFLSSPFGYDLDKLETLFNKRRETYLQEKKDTLLAEYDELKYERPWDDEEFDPTPHFDDFIVAKTFPFTKSWFELKIWGHIQHLKSEVSRRERLLSSQRLKSARVNDDMDDFIFGAVNGNIIEEAVLLGRTLEHYRWKFRFENGTISGERNSQARQKADAAKPIRANQRKLDMHDCIVDIWNELKTELRDNERANFLRLNNYAAALVHERASKTKPIALLIKKNMQLKSVHTILKAIVVLKAQERIY